MRSFSISSLRLLPLLSLFVLVCHAVRDNADDLVGKDYTRPINFLNRYISKFQQIQNQTLPANTVVTGYTKAVASTINAASFALPQKDGKNVSLKSSYTSVPPAGY
jgi:hypothetical protein